MERTFMIEGLDKSSALSHDSGNRNLMMLQKSVAKRELNSYPFAPGAYTRNACAFDPSRII
jgi:hypothetical protein